MYARGILFGKMKYELGDHAIVRCPETGFEVDIEFKVKGWVGGTYNAIGGFIKESKSGKNLFELSGHWHGEMFIKDLATGKKELLFDAAHSKPSIPKARPLEEQAPRESQKLWHTTTQAIKKADQKTATDEKSRIEDEQRREAAERGETPWKPKLFRPAPAGDEESLDWIIDAQVDDQGPAEKQIEQILAIAPILPGQTSERKPSSAQDATSSQHGTQAPSQLVDATLSQQSSHASQPPSQRVDGGLIDIGENEALGTSSSSGAQQPPQQHVQGPPNGLQEPLIPTKSESSITSGGRSRPGDPLRRMDSLGNEDVFMDAES